jgi:subtilisin-like proprotein convertase family protein
VPGLQGKILTGGVVDAARAVGTGTVVTPPPSTPSPLQVLSSIATGAVVNTFDNIIVNFSDPVDPSTLNNTNVALFGPNGQRITIQTFQATGAGGGTQIQLLFPSQTAGGTYTLFIGAGLQDKSGGALAATYQNSFLLSPIFSYQSTTPVGIPDVSSIAALLTVPQGFVINNVTINLNMVNSIDGLMILSLQAPDGTTVLLSNLRGGTGTGFLNTTFDDRASVPVGNGQAPFTGSYQPEQALGSFAGKNAQGTWKLIVVDHATNYHVLLTNWSLTFNTAGSSEISAHSPAVVRPTSVASQPAALSSASVASVSPIASDGAFGLAATAFELNQLPPASAGPARSYASTAPQAGGADRATQSSDALFASLDGIDRMAELRVMMPHADRSASAIDAAFADDAAYETDDGEVVATSWTDQ